eukprot:1158873-Pelagomonas_calceolata.AAC.2
MRVALSMLPRGFIRLPRLYLQCVQGAMRLQLSVWCPKYTSNHQGHALSAHKGCNEVTALSRVPRGAPSTHQIIKAAPVQPLALLLGKPHGARICAHSVGKLARAFCCQISCHLLLLRYYSCRRKKRALIHYAHRRKITLSLPGVHASVLTGVNEGKENHSVLTWRARFSPDRFTSRCTVSSTFATLGRSALRICVCVWERVRITQSCAVPNDDLSSM